MQGIWKDIKGYENCYQVSNYGRVRSLTRKVNIFNGQRTIQGKILKPLITNPKGISRCCRLKQKYANNYIWRYANK